MTTNTVQLNTVLAVLDRLEETLTAEKLRAVALKRRAGFPDGEAFGICTTADVALGSLVWARNQVLLAASLPEQNHVSKLDSMVNLILNGRRGVKLG